MKSFIEIYRLAKFPKTAELPSFMHHYPIGPSFAVDFANIFKLRGACVEQLDYDTNKISWAEEGEEISQSGDILYLIYDNPEQWVFVFSSDLDWGVIFSNIDLPDLERVNDISDAGIDFLEVYARRTTKYSEYYDLEVLNAWARVAGVAALGGSAKFLS